MTRFLLSCLSSLPHCCVSLGQPSVNVHGEICLGSCIHHHVRRHRHLLGQILRGNKQQLLLQTPESPQISVIQGPKSPDCLFFSCLSEVLKVDITNTNITCSEGVVFFTTPLLRASPTRPDTLDPITPAPAPLLAFFPSSSCISAVAVGGKSCQILLCVCAWVWVWIYMHLRT